jgi:hypothetical protein
MLVATAVKEVFGRLLAYYNSLTDLLQNLRLKARSLGQQQQLHDYALR